MLGRRELVNGEAEGVWMSGVRARGTSQRLAMTWILCWVVDSLLDNQRRCKAKTNYEGRAIHLQARRARRNIHVFAFQPPEGTCVHLGRVCRSWELRAVDGGSRSCCVIFHIITVQLF